MKKRILSTLLSLVFATVYTYTVAQTNVAPTVSLTAPANNASYAAPASVSLVANAADSDGSIAKVEFFNGGTLLPGSTNVLYPYEFTWTGVAAGTYTLTAKATDNAGAVTTSAPVTITVANVTNVPPTVVLTTPANNAAYSAPASVSLVATAADSDGSIAKVEFFNGGVLLNGSTNVLYPYEFTWTGVTAGTYTLTAKATDNAGAVSTSEPITITVLNTANAAPTVSLTSPANNATYSAPASVSLVANAADSDGSIAKVEFFNGGTLLTGSTNVSAPYEFTWTGVAAGTYTITAKATDNLGVVTTSAPVTITVSNTTNNAPTVSLTSPANNATYSAPASVSLVANAADSDGSIAKVEFFNGGVLLTGSTNVSAPYEFTWTGVAAGTYTITAKATDNLGVVTTSAPVTITVSNTTNNAPTVSLTSPVNNATYSAPASVSLVANAADSDGSIAKVEFFNGGVLLTGSTNVSAPYEFTWTGVAAGTYTITAKATDNRGAVTTSAPVTITVSNTTNNAPTVSLTSPANNATYSAPASVSLVVNAADSDGSIAKVEFFNGGVLLTGSTNVSAPYEFTWTGVAAGTYTITAKATDNRGAVTTSAPVTITVSTTTNVSPTISLTSPANNAIFSAPASVSLVANAADSDGSIAKVEFFNGGTLLTGSTNVSAPYEFTWTGVAAGTYTLTAKATDNRGAVTTSAPVTITVSTTTNVPPTVALTTPGNNAIFSAPASVSLVANAADSDGSIAKVEFFNGTTLLPGSTNLLAPYDFTWTGVAAGTYTLTAKATDNTGAVTTSAPITIRVDSAAVINGVIVGSNPFSDQTTIQIPHTSNTALTISIKDMSGITVWESAGLQTNKAIYIGSGLPTGIYIVSAYYAGTTKVTRLVKY